MATTVTPIEQSRLFRAKFTYAVRRVPRKAMATLVTGKLEPKAGDLILARVDRVRQHPRVELCHGRKSKLFLGDEIVVCYGYRYAPDQFEAAVPDDLKPCHLVAGGGIAGRMLSRHASVKPPTEITPLGLLGDAQGRPLNIGDYKLPLRVMSGPRPPLLTVVGTSMNSGKTTTAAFLIRGLVRYGLKVGGVKITGTGAGGDLWCMLDAGAMPVLDIVDAGLPSTCRRSFEELDGVADLLISHLQAAGVDVIVMEIADGIYQEETAGLLSLPAFTQKLDGVLFAALDAVGATAGADWLARRGLPLLGISGVFTSSPLGMREAQAFTGVPALTSKALQCPSIAHSLIADILARRGALKSAPVVQAVPAALSNLSG
ncbi:DUF1611 domain-containing protein [Desulfuromonas versatilis]|uniref:DUF1611 domain-containing protein n=1 Tax=Desulfuromonas versatilis TaxID=2802975 RepID=A0ABM8HV11_9BACT|nr:hypothetical protein [Desulfuromonas versatilis]BCR05834.1 DUF1611 domain-containing protein [Desulfuromonas versatilis]